jgi:L-lactate dehydrogenase complex protein LldF
LRREVAKAERPIGELAAFRGWSMAWRKAGRYRLFVRLSRLGQRLFTRRGRIGHAPYPLSKWTGGRDLPPVADRTFRERWSEEQR